MSQNQLEKLECTKATRVVFACLYLVLTGPFLDAISITLVGHVRKSVTGNIIKNLGTHKQKGGK